MAEPEFTTRGNEVKISGNTIEKTNCGKIEVYEDKVKIQQKGKLMSKGWVTVRYDDIVDIQVSSLGKFRLMTNRQDVSVTGLGGQSGTKLLEHVKDYLKNRKSHLENKFSGPQNEQENNTDKCPNCGKINALENTASCGNCGYIPPEDQM